jgi:hypothetical protein
MSSAPIENLRADGIPKRSFAALAAPRRSARWNAIGCGQAGECIFTLGGSNEMATSG